MFCMSYKNKSCGQLKRRLVALSLLLCFVIASLLATFIIIQAGHDCVGEDCPVCVQIGKTAVAVIVTVGLLTADSVRTRLDFSKGYPSTLVSVKIRMNN